MNKKTLLLGMTAFCTSFFLEGASSPSLSGKSSEKKILTQEQYYISQSNNIYTAKLGDTLSGIANKFSLTVEQLLSWNPELQDNPDLLLVGQKINLGNNQRSSSQTPSGSKPQSAYNRPQVYKPQVQTKPSTDISSTQKKPIQRKSAFQNLNLPNVIRLGGSRTAAKRGTGGLCTKDSQEQVKALLPESNFGYTLRDYPTFFWYLPELKSNSIPIVFKLREVKQDVKPGQWPKLYETSFTDIGSGIINFTLPPEAPPLEEGKEYEWEIQIQCDSQTWMIVRANIQRLPTDNPELTSKLENASIEDYPAILADAGVWYDVLPVIAALEQKHSQDLSWAEDWSEIMKKIGYNDLSNTFKEERARDSVLPGGQSPQ